MSLVTVFQQIRAQSEGDMVQAHKLAREAELPQLVVEYIALSTVWRDYAESFRALCMLMENDTSLPRFWRAAALESLGATCPPDQLEQRRYYFDSALEMVDDIDDQAEDDLLEREYIQTCVNASLNETPGMSSSIERLRDAADSMIRHGWFNAPGRLKAFLQGLGDNTDPARKLVAGFLNMEAAGNHYFSLRQTGFLKQAFPDLFTAPD